MQSSLNTLKVRKTTFKLFAIVGTFDTMAKCKIQSKVQFNGHDGCSYCHHPGIIVHRTIKYQHVPNISSRNEAETLKIMKSCLKTQSVIKGFKGCSPLVRLPFFNIIDGLAIDYMHNVLLGMLFYLI